MTEQELRAIPPFDKLPFVSEDDAETLCRYYDAKFDGSFREAMDALQVATLLNDPNLVPKGAIRYEGGAVEAIFWRLRTDG
jgi:hypothetical protein